MQMDSSDGEGRGWKTRPYRNKKASQLKLLSSNTRLGTRRQKHSRLHNFCDHTFLPCQGEVTLIPFSVTMMDWGGPLPTLTT